MVGRLDNLSSQSQSIIMQDKLNEILQRIDKLDNIFNANSSWSRKFFRFAEKLLIPIALGILALVANQASIKISNAQLELSRKEDYRKELEFEANLQTKYLELFYEDINSDDSRKQSAALKLLNIMRPELGKVLADLAEGNPNLSTELKAEARSIKTNIITFGALNKHKIGIYVRESNLRFLKLAEDIRNRMFHNGFKGIIQIYKESDSFFDYVVPPDSYEIRYEETYEDEAADQLEAVLREIYPSIQFTKTPVGNRSPNFISIFLGP